MGPASCGLGPEHGGFSSGDSTLNRFSRRGSFGATEGCDLLLIVKCPLTKSADFLSGIDRVLVSVESVLATVQALLVATNDR